MRALIQRVSHASVGVDGLPVGSIGAGLLVFLGITDADDQAQADWLCGKIVHLRLFDDAAGVMNDSVLDTGGEILLVSQFTLYAATKKGNRPSYIMASKPEKAVPLYEYVVARLSSDLGKPVETGRFGADMKVSLLNDGPVTIWIDSLHRE